MSATDAVWSGASDRSLAEWRSPHRYKRDHAQLFFTIITGTPCRADIAEQSPKAGNRSRRILMGHGIQTADGKKSICGPYKASMMSEQNRGEGVRVSEPAAPACICTALTRRLIRSSSGCANISQTSSLPATHRQSPLLQTREIIEFAFIGNQP